jgi:putative chitinase
MKSSKLGSLRKDLEMLTFGDLQKAARGTVNKTNAQSVLGAVEIYGEKFGLNKPHREVQFFAQLMHESGEFRYDKEIWGPTPAQERYDVRTDLGNTKAKDGDGKKYMGRAGIQITGKANYEEFTEWCRKNIDKDAPDFVKYPEKINTDPWEGLVPIWYWTTRNLNKYADRGDIEQITKAINGGLNGYDDRINKYVRLALTQLGYSVNGLEAFQRDHGVKVDNDPGPRTRSALHTALVKLTPGELAKPSVQVAPVTEKIVETKTVETEVAVPVTPPSMEAPWWKSKEVLGPLISVGGIGGATTFFEKFGSIPVENLAVILGFVTAALIGTLLYLKHRDRQAVKTEVKRIG